MFVVIIIQIKKRMLKKRIKKKALSMFINFKKLILRRIWIFNLGV